MPLTDAERKLRAKHASLVSWANTPDPTARTAPSATSLPRQFENKVDLEGKMAPAERARRAENARKAHFASMALKSATARRLKRERGSSGDAA